MLTSSMLVYNGGGVEIPDVKEIIFYNVWEWKSVPDIETVVTAG